MSDLLNDDKKVTIDAVVRRGMSLSLDGELHSVLHSCRNLDLDGLASAYQTCAAAGSARIVNDFSFASALRTGRIGHRPSEQGVDHSLGLTGSVTCRTGLDIGGVLGSSSSAVRTRPVSFDRDLLLRAGGDLLKGKAHPCTDVTSLHHPLLLASALTAAKSAES